MTYVLASNNPGKAQEIRPLFAAAGLRLVTLAELGRHFVPGEDTTTFEGNARQKAAETAAFLAVQQPHGGPFTVLADDSGLQIDALGGLPGVDSALYLGEETPYEVRNAHILAQLANVPDAQRTARFVCVVACCLPDGALFTTTATCEGRIAHTPQGCGGFGYDPIFLLPEMGRGMAELSREEKNGVSHRGRAMGQMLTRLATRF